MLTLQKGPRSTEIVEIHQKSTRSKKAAGKVYFTHDAAAEGNVAPCAGVLALHKDALKKIHKLSNTDFERICIMIDTNEEPDVGDSLRTEYWELKKMYERALRTEMWLGDQDDLYFEHNLPRDRDTWGGNFLMVGNSGAGKTYWVVQLLLRYLRATKPHSRRTIIYISPEAEIDTTLKPLKDKRFAFNTFFIDVSADAVKKSSLSAAEYYQTNVESVIEKHGERACIIYDDFMDAAPGMEQLLRRDYIHGLRTARHKKSVARALVRERPQHLPGDPEREVRGDVPGELEEPDRDVYEGPFAHPHQGGEGAGAPVREDRPVDGDPYAQPRRDLQLQVPAPGVTRNAYIFSTRSLLKYTGTSVRS